MMKIRVKYEWESINESKDKRKKWKIEKSWAHFKYHKKKKHISLYC
jgi:hypothetical protein